MKAAILIDDWKLPIFERHLKQADYSYEQGAGITKNTILLRVVYTDVNALEKVVRAANTEASIPIARTTEMTQ